MDHSPQAIIFDLDGTLLDTLTDLATAANHALTRFGYPTRPVEAYRRFLGSGGATLMTRALPPGEAESLGEAGLRPIMEAMRAYYQEHAADATLPYPGIAELLATVRERAIQSGVLSNKPHAATLAVIRHFFGSHSFAAVQGHVPDMPLKPDPTSALAMAGTLGLAPSRILYVGDSDVDMFTARAAGMRAVGAAWGFRGADELWASGADHVCATPLEVAALLPTCPTQPGVVP
jgi:phosphoglycolate phosphatase